MSHEVVKALRSAAVALLASDSPAHRVAVNLLIEAPDLPLDEARKMVLDAPDGLWDPESGELVPSKDVARELQKLIPEAAPGEVVVYHATDPATAKLLLRRGFVPETKPRPRGQMDYAPGRGIDPGLYVGESPKAVDSYGRAILEVHIPKRFLEVPTELRQLGEADPMRALKSHDGAVINKRLAPSAFRLLGSTIQARSVGDAESMFWEAVEAIWGQDTAAKLKPTFRATDVSPPKTGRSLLAALRYAPPVRAIGDILFIRAKSYQLVINPALLEREDDFIRKIMIHEAVHIGHPRHDADFRQLVREHGGAVSESDAEGEGIRVQKKDGPRYKTIKTFNPEQEHEAERWMKDQSKAEPGRYRMLF